MMEDEENFKKYLKEEKYNKCIDIIRNKIINHVIMLIKQKKSDYEYTDIIDLIDMSNIYLTEINKNIASKIDYFSIQEEPLNKLERLLLLCNTYGIK